MKILQQEAELKEEVSPLANDIEPNVQIGDKQYYMDGYLLENLQRAKSIIKKDWDMVFLYDGYEGSGKSVKAMQDAYFCDPTLSLDRVTFSPWEFSKAIKGADKYQAVIYDEAFTGFLSRQTMTLINTILVKMLAEIRQKNLFVFIVMPSFFDIDRYVSLWRSRALIHVYIGDNHQRGYFSFYNHERKKDLYMMGKKHYSYAKPAPNFIGRFTNYYPLDEKAYRQKKNDALTRKEKGQDYAMTEKEFRNKLFERLMKVDYISEVAKAGILNVSMSTYYFLRDKYKNEEQFEIPENLDSEKSTESSVHGGYTSET